MKTALLATRTLTGANAYEQLRATLEKLGTTELHHGGEGAAKQHAERWQKETGGDLVEHAPNWKEHGKAAGPIRGKELVKAGETVVAIWDAQSKGTANELKEARRQGKRVTLILVQ